MLFLTLPWFLNASFAAIFLKVWWFHVSGVVEETPYKALLWLAVQSCICMREKKKLNAL